MTYNYLNKSSIIIALPLLLFVASFCSKTNENITLKSEVNGLSLDSISATQKVIRAWDTTYLHAYASGKGNFNYLWEADHGTLLGEGESVIYWAGECCVGINTITCTVDNDSAKVSDTVKIKVYSYFD